jgi:uncharacterized protein YcbK (DUF882 family)
MKLRQPLIEMLNDWVTWMKSNGFKGNNGNYISVISGYRTVETQEEIKITHLIVQQYQHLCMVGVLR